MKRFVLILGILLLGAQAFALDVVYPKKTVVSINSPSTFFVGSANPGLPLTINDQPVKVHPSGAFAQSVKLNNGKNVFNLQSGDKIKTYIIDRPIYTPGAWKQPCFEELSLNVLTADDNVPLRKTPENFGINRLSHLPKDVPLVIDGAQGEFFRTPLGAGKGWVHKNNVKKVDEAAAPAVFKKFERKDTADFYVFNFEFDRKTPYAMQEGNPFKLTFYNVADFGGRDGKAQSAHGEENHAFASRQQSKTADCGEYVFTWALKQKLIGYCGKFEGEKFVLKIRKYPRLDKALKGITIAVDAGHGGYESGAVGCLGNLEKDVNLAISKYLQEELAARGAQVIMTRKDDSCLALYERVDIANENNADILISVHANSLPDSADPNANRGTSVYYYYNQAKPLADSVLNSMLKQAGTQDDKVRQGSLALVRNTDALSILVEVAYMINPYDTVLLTDRDFQKSCAKAIADGVADYLNRER
jgi:N-acetylmuramoyl-L-alanine amidase